MSEPKACETTLVLFLPSGRTFTFRKTSIRIDNETHLVFAYVAMSDGRHKLACIQKSQIVGFSTFPD
jgi:hypothetical protein